MISGPVGLAVLVGLCVTVGLIVGVDDGSDDGVIVGWKDLDGAVDGVADGCIVGASDGDGDGAGDDVGSSVGPLLGKVVVGKKVGCVDGSCVSVGLCVSVGTAEGDGDGAGLDVGAGDMVGGGCGPSCPSTTSTPTMTVRMMLTVNNIVIASIVREEESPEAPANLDDRQHDAT